MSDQIGALQDKLDSMTSDVQDDQELDTKQIMMRINLLKSDIDKKVDHSALNAMSEDLKERIDQLQEELTDHKNVQFLGLEERVTILEQIVKSLEEQANRSHHITIQNTDDGETSPQSNHGASDLRPLTNRVNQLHHDL